MATIGKNLAKAYKAKSSPQAVALHTTDGVEHVVGIGNIKVIICKDGDNTWFAQGLDIDYAANGHNLEEVKTNFQIGLKGTIDLHIKAYGHIEKFLRVAPQNVWNEFYAVATGTHYRYSQVSFHDDLSKTLGFQGINFIVRPEEVIA
jgi:hypothetical protein